MRHILGVGWAVIDASTSLTAFKMVDGPNYAPVVVYERLDAGFAAVCNKLLAGASDLPLYTGYASRPAE